LSNNVKHRLQIYTMLRNISTDMAAGEA